MKFTISRSLTPLMSAIALVTVAAVLWRSPAQSAEPPVVISAPAVDNAKAAGAAQTAVLAGGCFWGVQGVFEHVRGVQKVVAGYAGGEAIFYADDTQKHIAEAYIRQLEGSHAFARAIVTRVDPLKGFYAAENYHQDYLVHNPTSPYIAMYDLPKIENFKRLFPELYSGHPVLVSAR
jgi:hypothetical protein